MERLQKTSCMRSQLSTLMLIDQKLFPKFTPNIMSIYSSQDEMMDVFCAMCNNIDPFLKVVVFSDRVEAWKREAALNPSSRFVCVHDQFLPNVFMKQICIKDTLEEEDRLAKLWEEIMFSGSSDDGSSLSSSEEDEEACVQENMRRIAMKNVDLSLNMAKSVMQPTVTVLDFKNNCEFNRYRLDMISACKNSMFVVFMNNTPMDTVRQYFENDMVFRHRNFFKIVRDPRVTTDLPLMDSVSAGMLLTFKGRMPVVNSPPLQFSCHVTSGSIYAALQDLNMNFPTVSHAFAMDCECDKKAVPIHFDKNFAGDLAIVVSNQFILTNANPVSKMISVCFRTFPQLVYGKSNVLVTILQIFTNENDDNSLLISDVTRKVRANWIFSTPVNCVTCC